MNSEFKKFLFRGCIFIIPVILFFGISFYILWVSGELKSPDILVDKQISQVPTTIGMAYTDPFRYIKLHYLLKKHPEIVLFGSSRSSQMRSHFFKFPETFYNAYIGGERIEGFNILLDKIPAEKQPKIILIGLDSDFFNECDAADKTNIEYEYTEEFNRSNSLRAWQYGYTHIYIDYFLNKFPIRNLLKLGNNPNKIGLLAAIYDTGYRNDGSSINNVIMSAIRYHHQKNDFRETFKNNFLAGVSEHRCPDRKGYALKEIEKFLKKCESRNIYVIGFIPPYAAVVLANMGGDPRYGPLKALVSDLEPLFNKYRFGFHDLLDISKIDPTDKEMVDATHGSEKTTLRLFLLMLNREPILEQYTDKEYLEKLLKNSESSFYVLEDAQLGQFPPETK